MAERSTSEADGGAEEEGGEYDVDEKEGGAEDEGEGGEDEGEGAGKTGAAAAGAANVVRPPPPWLRGCMEPANNKPIEAADRCWKSERGHLWRLRQPPEAVAQSDG
jgi:hypothetical protein